MTKANDLSSYLDEEIPREALLGHIVIYTINDGQYERDKLVTWFTELGLDQDFLPAASKPIDAYRRATNDANDFEYDLDQVYVFDGEGKRGVQKGDYKAHILVRDVLSNDKIVERHLIREIRDGRRRALSHSKVGEARFTRPRLHNGRVVQDSHRFHIRILQKELTPGERAPLQDVLEKISKSFDRHLYFLDGMKVRSAVREYIKSLSGIELKPSVYFIPIAQADELAKISALVDRLGHDCSMQLIGLMDTAKQRDIVIKAWQTETEDALKELVKAIAHLRATRKNISVEAFAKIRAEYDAILERGAEYRKALALSTDVTESAAEIAYGHLEQLAESMMGATS